MNTKTRAELIDTFINGEVLLFDKPYKWSSFDVVNKVRSMMQYVLGIKKLKVGHAGTLDPLATGLLILCTGKATKIIDQFQGQHKDYSGSFFMGQTTPSFDLETSPDQEFDISHLNSELIIKAGEAMVGEHQQMPPLYSAKKIEGERAYEFARRGETTTLKKSSIVVHSFKITRIELPEVDFEIRCSKGTYIRSIARDFGLALNCGSYLKSLHREKIGDYHVKDAWQLKDFENYLREVKD